jgi:rubrerythrin
MSSQTEERIKALEIALNNESQARDFYLQHGRRTQNSIGKMMFASIAADEDES